MGRSEAGISDRSGSLSIASDDTRVTEPCERRTRSSSPTSGDGWRLRTLTRPSASRRADGAAARTFDERSRRLRDAEIEICPSTPSARDRARCGDLASFRDAEKSPGNSEGRQPGVPAGAGACVIDIARAF